MSGSGSRLSRRGAIAAGAASWLALRQSRGQRPARVDPSTLTGKVLSGYQGWFAAPGDGSELGWVHYGGGDFGPGSCTFDLWPDTAEFDDDEKFATPFRHADGSTAYVFSPHVRKTVVRHFAWMREHGLDGIFLQRFGVSVRDARHLRHRDQVTLNVQAGAAEHGRVWANMYDLSGLREGQIETVVKPDWRHLVEDLRVTADAAYLHHAGRPLCAVWGIGFNDGRRYTLAECGELIDHLKQGGCTVMIGIPTFWRSQTRDAVDDPRLHEVLLKADILSPWTIGRFGTPEAARRYAAEEVAADLAWCAERGKEYLPVAFPGFSWHNLMKSRGTEAPLDAIPRRGGEFLWAQYAAYRAAGATMVYQAMFDEIDEGTAIFRVTNDPPVGDSPFVTYEGLPSDHYLWLVGQATRMMRGELPLSEAMPRRG